MTAKFQWAVLMGAVLFNLQTPVMAQDQAVSGEQVKAMWSGKKVFGRSSTGSLLDFYLKVDGTSQVSVGNMVDSGTWRPTDKGYCATWQKIRAGEERCFTVVNRGPKLLVLNPDGSVSAEILRVVD